MPVSIESKLPNVGTTIFTVMSSLAVQHRAVNLGQGFPDYPMSEQLIEAVNEAMISGFNQYVHMNGLPLLREVIAEKIAFLYNNRVSPDTDVTITPGGTYAIYTAITATLHPGDEVIIFQPGYDSYIPNVIINGGIPVLVDLKFPGYSIDWEEVKSKITARTKLIILNSPHNPTGAVLQEEDMIQLSNVVRGTSIIIVSDEVYEHLIFDGIGHQSMLRYPELFERSFVCFSFGKVYHCTGWKLGYVVSPPALMNEFRKVHQFNCFSCHSPSQVGLAKYLQLRDSYLSLPGFMQQKRDFFQQMMAPSKFSPLPSHGSYFQLYSYAEMSDEPDHEFCMRLTTEYGVVAIPVSAFYQSGKDDKVVRFCFAKKEETLAAAAEKLRGI